MSLHVAHPYIYYTCTYMYMQLSSADKHVQPRLIVILICQSESKSVVLLSVEYNVFQKKKSFIVYCLNKIDYSFRLLHALHVHFINQ